ncbi:hypothetical protein [Clostridium tunisiense]|nr:hypothetical protein [Clostridium tunisiense]
MSTKSQKQNKDNNKSKNPKTANPITMETDKNMHKPVRGLPNV